MKGAVDQRKQANAGCKSSVEPSLGSKRAKESGRTPGFWLQPAGIPQTSLETVKRVVAWEVGPFEGQTLPVAVSNVISSSMDGSRVRRV